MQSLRSRAAPVQSTSRCVSCLSTSASEVTSRGATAASKRRLRIGNSVTALYTSIFAAAALADAQAKDKRLHEWEEKIAAVKEEVNELADEEKRLIASLTTRRRRRLFNGTLQVRPFSTTTHWTPRDRRSTIPNTSCRTYSTASPASRAMGEESQPQMVKKIVEELEPSFYEDSNGDSLLAAELENQRDSWTYSASLVRRKVVQKLALRQLAIRLLLRPVIAHSYLGQPMNYGADFSVPQLNVAELLAELNTIRHKIRHIQESNDEPVDGLARGLRTHLSTEMAEEQKRLDLKLQSHCESFISENISLQELLIRIASNLLESTDPDRPKAIRLMLMTFSQTRQNDLADLVLRTVLPHRFKLSASTINTILTFFRKTKNLKDFDMFLEMLAGEGYPLDLGYLRHYERRKINGMEIIVPPTESPNPVTYSILVTAALRFDQPERAEAWLESARGIGLMDNFTTLFAQLRFYSVRDDWEKGLSVLRRGLAYMISSTNLRPEGCERLVALMVFFCDMCNKLDVSQALITAAVKAGFDVSLAQNQRDLEWPVDLDFQRWTDAEKLMEGKIQIKPVWEKCYAFADFVGDLLISEDMETFKKKGEMSKLHSKSHLSVTMDERLRTDDMGSDAKPPASAQTQDITALKNEVEQLKQMVRQLHEAKIDEGIRQQAPPEPTPSNPVSASTGPEPSSPPDAVIDETNAGIPSDSSILQSNIASYSATPAYQSPADFNNQPSTATKRKPSRPGAWKLQWTKN